MSELINNTSQRQERLLLFAELLIKGGDGNELINKYRYFITRATPADVIYITDALMQKDYDINTLKPYINKIINVLFKPLQSYKWDKPSDGGFIHTMMLENAALTARLNTLKPLIKEINGLEQGTEHYNQVRKSLRSGFEELQVFNLHYVKKENILFPYLEKAWPDYRCLGLMWSFDDDIRRYLKSCIQHCSQEIINLRSFNYDTGKLYFLMSAIRFREDHILFPAAIKTITRTQAASMLEQANEQGYAFIETPEPDLVRENEKATTVAGLTSLADRLEGVIQFDTGRIQITQLERMLNVLPVDITYIDENDVVRYYSAGPHRIFPRSKAVIGRTVQNCHPPESIETVNKLLNDFKNGSKNNESFWIQIRGQFLLINYYAIRDEKGKYKGTVEVSQNITELRQLNGEKRLLS